jgi:hypothetical protein
MNNAFAIAVLAKREAIKAVKADMQARGIRLSYVSPRDIRIVAQEYLTAHPELLTQAAHIIATDPRFAFAKLNNNAQSQKQPKSITSAVQISCAK